MSNEPAPTPKVIDVDLYFSPNTKKISSDPQGNNPISQDFAYSNNQLFSSYIIRLKTIGQKSLYPNDATINYDYPSTDILKKAQSFAFFTYNPVIWLTPEGGFYKTPLLMAPPSNISVTRSDSGTTIVIANTNTLTGSQSRALAYNFILSVYYQGNIYGSDPVVINEPYIDNG